MTLSATLRRRFPDHFLVLLLDNEVTVGSFVARLPCSWLRLTHKGGVYGPGRRTAKPLTAERARAEARLWDHVSGLALIRTLTEMDDGIDRVVFGNNAGQGLALAECLAEPLRRDRGAVIYAEFLPERDQYRRLGFRTFLPRKDFVVEAARWAAPRPLAVAFVNTIQHHETSFHEP